MPNYLAPSPHLSAPENVGDHELDRLELLQHPRSSQINACDQPDATPIRASHDTEASIGSSLPLAKGVSLLHALVLIVILISLSCSMIVFNKWIYQNLGFPYPLILTAWHLVFATVCTQVLARTTKMLNFGSAPPMTLGIYCQTILPVSALFLLSLGSGNMAYLYLTVSFIQMLKAATPIAVLLCTWAFGLRRANACVFLNVLVIASGVFIASIGEASLNALGIALQAAGIITEAIRLVYMQKIMVPVNGQKMNALLLLYYYAPSCAAMNLLCALAIEKDSLAVAHVARVGPLVFLANAILAFMMNIIVVVVVDRVSGLAITLAGVFRTVLVVVCSVVLFKDRVTMLQVVGFSISTIGLGLYQLDLSAMSAECLQRRGTDDLATHWLTLKTRRTFARISRHQI